ncbi:MAG: AMP-binding protein [Deltaproteobacteria bacterium]|nr:AMP-binding protein [Deltaproteobacteria bacterium]
MERRWRKVWPVWCPTTCEVDRPTSEYAREWANLTPSAAALTFNGRDISYAELNRLIDRLAWGLVGLGLAKGDRVAVHMANCPQFVLAYFATQRAGGVVVAVNPMFRAAEIEHELNDAGVTVLIGLDSLYPEVERVRAKTPLETVILTAMGDFGPTDATGEKPSFSETVSLVDLIERSSEEPICRVDDLKADLALLQYTGGTTGAPKGAMISHHALASAAIGTMYWWHLREDDVYLGVTPFFHVMGQVALMCGPLVSGGRVVVLPRFLPDLAAQTITRYRCTFWVAATPMIIALLALPEVERYELGSLRCVVTGGAPISVELQNRFSTLAPKAAMAEGYGLSETICQGGAVTPIHRYKPGFLGVPNLNSDIKIMDQDTGTRELGPNEPGEIVIRSPSMTLGYWNQPEESARMLRDGWLYTGDTGLMDEEGYVKFLGRTREMIKCSGFSVFPAEVENLIYAHPAVREVVVIGVDDPYRGESPKAFIVLKEEFVGSVSEAAIVEWCKDNMAAYKRPHVVEFRQELPKSPAGKFLKRLLIEEEKQRV